MSFDIHFVYALIAAALDVAANLASRKSDGFRNRLWGATSILLVLAAFAFLAEAAKGMDLAVAYAVLGSTGIFATAILGRLLFGQRLKPIGWLGLLLVFSAVVVLKTA